MQPHPLVAILDELDRKGLTFYDSGEENPLLNLDLGVARTDHEIDIAGDFLCVESLDGIAKIRFNAKRSDLCSLNRIRSYTTPFRRVFITNTAQVGKTLILAIGRDASFIAKTLETIRLVDVAGIEINPAIKEQLVPLEKASIHGTAELIDTDILATDLVPTNTPCLFRILVVLETSGVFSAMLISGAVAKKLMLNAGGALSADCAYLFDILVHSGDTVNFQTSVAGNVTMRVQEIVGGVQ